MSTNSKYINVNVASLQGVRDENEDRHRVILNLNKTNSDYNAINYYAVYDGHGGDFVSNFLYKNMHMYFMNLRVKYPLNRNYVLDVYNSIQTILREKYKKQSDQCGSTCLIALICKHKKDKYLTVLNVGDSRGILCDSLNRVIPLSKDHKPEDPEEKNRIKKLGGVIEYSAGDDPRIEGLSLSRAIGDLDAEKYVSHLPDLFGYKINKNDKFMVLACDGLWDVLDNKSVVNYVLKYCYDANTQKRNSEPINIANKLAHYAIQQGSTDNVSVVVVFLDNI